MANRNELFILAARYKVSAAHFSKLHRAARVIVDQEVEVADLAGDEAFAQHLADRGLIAAAVLDGIDIQVDAPAVFAAVDQINADQYALLDFIKALPDLHLHCVGDSDWVAGEDEAQVWAEWSHATGSQPDEVGCEIRQEPDDKAIECSVDAKGYPCESGDDGSSKVTRTAGEWAALLGPGFAFSENY